MFAVTCYNLKQLHLNNNRLKIFNAEYRFLSSFDSIRLDYNNLHDFPTSIYYTVMSFNDLNFSGNPIGTLEPLFFYATNRIFNLYFKNCSIFLIKNDTFVKLHILITLDLSYNNLYYLEKNCFCELESLEILNLSYNSMVFIHSELFKESYRLKNLDLSNNELRDIEDTAFVNLASLKIINLDMNPIIEPFNNYTFMGLSQLKHMTVSIRVNFTLEIVQSIRYQIKQRLVRQVLFMMFYDSIEISFPPNFSDPYSTEICYYVSYLIRNQIGLNLVDELYVQKYIHDCKAWSFYIYNNKLDGLIDSIFN
jgi:hypothetical protein